MPKWFRGEAPAALPVHVPSRPGRAALEELGQVPWRKLGHAYTGSMGAIVARHAVPGDDVEAILRALWDPDPELRDEAYADGLVATIWHQGTVYEATAFAVPFLAAFATDPALPSRGNVLSALVLIARSASQGNAEDPIITNKALEALRASRHFLEQLASGEPAVAAETGRTLLRVVDGDEGALEDAEDLLDGLNGWANAEEEEAAADEEE